MGARVVRVEPGVVTLSTGEELCAKSVVAVEGRVAAELLSDTSSPAGHGTTCVYFRHYVLRLPNRCLCQTVMVVARSPSKSPRFRRTTGAENATALNVVVPTYES